MSRIFVRPRRLRAVALASLLSCGIAAAQDRPPTSLPEITVTAPRVSVKRRPVRVTNARVPQARAVRSGRALTPTPAALPLSNERVATLMVVPNEELRRSGGATLGDLLFDKPGITGSGFAPGAASRPIIRGLDGNRVGIVENGTNSGGVSELGEDHFVPIDPLATGEVRVIRGPEALRYGSTTLGGVVSATNDRIPDRLPACAITSAGLRHRGDTQRDQFGGSRGRRRRVARRRW